MIAGFALTILIVAGLVQVIDPARGPLAVLVALVTSAWPLRDAWNGARGTGLRPAVTWSMLAVGLGIVAEALAWFEPPGSGRPLAGHLVYVSVLSTLAALVSVLNARTPGAAAWAILTSLLVLVFLIPWLEGPGLARKAQGLGHLRLDAPWSVFYVLVVIAGVTNYLPTRYGPAAAWLALGFAWEYAALTRSELRMRAGGRIWVAVPWTLAAAAWTAWWRSRRAGGSRHGVDAAWLWFRDHWGVVWALRIQERFNRAAEAHKWTLRLGWYGTVPAAEGAVDVPDAAEATLLGLLRRFASPGRIREAIAGGSCGPCQPPEGG